MVTDATVLTREYADGSLASLHMLQEAYSRGAWRLYTAHWWYTHWNPEQAQSTSSQYRHGVAIGSGVADSWVLVSMLLRDCYCRISFCPEGVRLRMLSPWFVALLHHE